METEEKKTLFYKDKVAELERIVGMKQIHIERVNGIIKNEYLAHLNIKSLTECQRTLNKAVKLYNTVRPHWSLGGLTPGAYEINLKTVPYSERFHLEIFHEEDRSKCQNVKEFELEF